MSIYHFSAQIISRSSGRSSVAAAAYRSGEKMTDERTGLIHDFRRKKGVDHSEIFLPKNAPERLLDRATLWQEVEKVEKRKDSQLAREIDVALPSELSREQQIDLAQRFVKETFVEKGMCADLCIHDLDSDNPHFHVMLTTRNVDESGFTTKNRDWNDRELLKIWREEWANYANSALEKNGFSERIDHRTLLEQNITDRPQVHLGPARSAMLKKGMSLYSIDEQLLTQRAQRSASEKIKEAELYSQSQSIEHELTQLEYELQQERARADEQRQLEARISAVRDALSSEETAEYQVSERATSIRNELTSAEQQVSELERAVKDAQQQHSESADTVAELEQYLSHTQAQLDSRGATNSIAQDSVRAAEEHIQRAKSKQQELESEVKDAQSEHEKAQRLQEFKQLNFLERRKRVRELESSIESVDAQLSDTTIESTDVKKAVEYVEHRLSKLPFEIAELESAVAELEKTTPSSDQLTAILEIQEKIEKNWRGNGRYHFRQQESLDAAAKQFFSSTTSSSSSSSSRAHTPSPSPGSKPRG